ncbi:MAG: hypothetical protein KDC79_01220 [Cyclobacteriaceae bacterium]|nr:hypothetical protein [Cyclobacteriaceae bacterium]
MKPAKQELWFRKAVLLAFYFAHLPTTKHTMACKAPAKAGKRKNSQTKAEDL